MVMQSLCKLGLLCLSFHTASATAEAEQQHPVIEWLMTRNGGYFNSDKVEARNGGMFAKKDIAQGELVVTVPPAALLGPGPEEDGDFCDTARRLVTEYTKGSDSEYQPYLKYVFESFPHARMPMAWSAEGKQLIRNMVGDEGFGTGSFAAYCLEDESASTPLLEAAWRIVVSRGWDQVMVPVFDMFNHRNGKYRNVDRDPSGGSMEVDGDYNIVALREIKAGEPLHNSYNQCHDVTCAGDTALWYVTPNILSEYGFVEQYPRRFAFDTGYDDDEELGLVVEITEDDDGKLEATWLTGEPNEEQQEWLLSQWDRLHGLEPQVQLSVTTLRAMGGRDHEAEIALEYYEALSSALRTCVAGFEVAEEEEEAVEQEVEVAAVPDRQIPSGTLMDGVAEEMGSAAAAAALDQQKTEL